MAAIDLGRIIATAGEFMEENRELVEDPEIDYVTIQALLEDGSEIGKILSEQTHEKMDKTAAKARQVEKAKRQRAKPIYIRELVKEHTELTVEHEAYLQTLQDFMEFMKTPQRMYINMVRAQAEEDDDDEQKGYADSIEADFADSISVAEETRKVSQGRQRVRTNDETQQEAPDIPLRRKSLRDFFRR